MKNDNSKRIFDHLNEQNQLFEQRTLGVKEFELKLSANIDSKEIPDVFEFFSPIRLVFDGGLNLLSHPKPAINCTLGNLFLKNKVNGKLNIDVGKDVRKIDQNSHSCYRVDARDSTRLIRCNNEEAIGLYYGEKSPFYCQDGVENCDFQAETMTLNHVYLSVDALAKAIASHGTSCVYLNMYLPDLYYSGIQGFNKKTGVGIIDDRNLIVQSMELFAFDASRDSSNLFMFFDDSSTPYVHDKKEWMEWYTIAGKVYSEYGFNLVIEKFRNCWGSYQIQVTVDRKGGSIPYHIEDKSHPYAIVYDVTSIADMLPERNLTEEEVESWLRSVKSVIVPVELYDKIMQFIVSKSDKTIDRQFVSAFLRSENQTIKLGGATIKEKFDISSESSNILVKNLFVHACFDRMVQTKEIGSSFDGRKALWTHNLWPMLSIISLFLALTMNSYYHDECVIQYSRYPIINSFLFRLFGYLNERIGWLDTLKFDLSFVHNWTCVDDWFYENLHQITNIAWYLEILTRFSLPLLFVFKVRVSLLLLIILNIDIPHPYVMSWYDYIATPNVICEFYHLHRYVCCIVGLVSFICLVVSCYINRKRFGKESWFGIYTDYRYSNIHQKNTHRLMEYRFKKGERFGEITLPSHSDKNNADGVREFNVIPDPCSTPGACLLEALSIVMYNDRKIVPQLYECHYGDIPPEGISVGVIDTYRGELGFKVGEYVFGDGRIELKQKEQHVTVENPCCEHGVGYEPYNVWNKTALVSYEIRNKLSIKTHSKHTPSFWTNMIKTGELRHLFPEDLHVACAAPGNDLKILAELNPSISTYYKNKTQVEMLKNRCRNLGLSLSYRNVCCSECMKGFSFIYADVGSAGDLSKLVALQFRTLINFLYLRCKFVCKLQNFVGSIVEGVPGTHELLKVMRLLDVRYTITANPSEIIINNVGYGDPILGLVGPFRIINVTVNKPRVIRTGQKGGAKKKTYASIDDLSKFGEASVNYEKVIQAYLQLPNELKQTDDEYRALNDKVIEKISNVTCRRIKTLRVLNTPAGGGKTTKIIEYCKKNQNCVVIAPYKRLKAEYVEKGIESYTMVAGMLEELRGKTIFLDEYYAYSPGIAAFYFRIDCDLILAGDPFQNSFHDENRIYDNLNVRDFYERECECRTNISYSVPHDVIEFINHNHDYKAVTESKVINSVSHHATLEEIENYRDLPIFCFAKSKKKALAERGLNVNTVAAIQGVRVKKCILMAEGGNAIINSVPGQIVVGLTRHTERLYVVGRHGKVNVTPLNAIFGSLRIRENKLTDEFNFEIGEKFSVDRSQLPVVVNTPASHHINLFNYANLDLIGDDRSILDNEEKFRNNTALFHMNTQRVDDPIVVEEIMSRISPTSLPFGSEIYYLQHRQLPMPDNPITIDLSKIEEPRDMEITRICGALRGRPNHSRNSLQSIYTMISRYGLNKKRPKDAHKFADDLFCAWKSFTHIGFSSLSCRSLQRAVMEQVRCIAEKKELQDEMLEDDVGKIRFFLKTQTKADLKEDSWIRLKPDGTTKGGQGISAQPKAVNHAFGPWARAIEEKIREEIHESIFLGYGENHHSLSQRIVDRIEKGLPVILFQGDDVAFYNGVQGFELDISEQDRMRGYWSDLFMRKVYNLFGVPRDLVMLLEKHNVRWKLQGKEASLIVDECFQSGRADTLLSNTLVSMALFALHFKFIKGRICEVRHHEDLKVGRCEYPSFVGHIVTPSGLVIDVPRMVAKLVNRNLNACYEEYRLAVMDWCSKVTDLNYHETIHANAHKYGITAIDVETLIGFLYSFVEGRIFNTNSNRGNCLINDYKAMTVDL